MLHSHCNRVVSDFKTCFTLPCNQTVVRSRTKFMKVCEKPCSIIGWLWKGQFLRGEYVTVIVSGADTPLPASDIRRPLSPFIPYAQVQVTMSQATHPQGLGWPSLQVALEHPIAAVNLSSQYSKGIFISLPVKWKQWDRSACRWLLLDRMQVALGHGRAVALGVKHVWCNFSLLASFDSPCFAVCTPFPIAEA